MNQEKRKRALALFEQPIDSENIAPYRNKYFHTTMAQDSLTNLDIDIDYENYDVIASGGDITIIDPDDPDDPIIINPTQLKASWVGYQQPSGVSATNVQMALDDLYDKNNDLQDNIDDLNDKIDSISVITDYEKLQNKPSINGEIIIGSKNGQDYFLVNGKSIDGKGGPIPIPNINSLLT